MQNVVRSVNCPNCHRDWTGSFPESEKSESIECKDCAPGRVHRLEAENKQLKERLDKAEQR